ncbi:MAG: long-chain acyl-CoA synthetase [Thermodesulfobacteriota bacterium]|nr:long-chain acyl-CoA synthetase [Thermodesulfobacteriota bacterium]
MTIVEMLEKTKGSFSEKTAIICAQKTLSYDDVYIQSNALANFLVATGLKKGGYVGVMLKKSPEVVVSFLGVAAAGGIVFPVDYTQTLAHIQYILNLTKPSALVVEAEFQPLLSKLDLTCPEERILVIGKMGGGRYSPWRGILSGRPRGRPDVKVQEDDVVYLNFTSGTTGVPKAAVATHENIYWNTLASIEALNLTPDDIHLCLFPVFGHPHELFARPLYLGGTIVLIDSIAPKTIAKAISDNRVTCMMGVASIYQTLIRFHESNPFDSNSLRVPESGGMHIYPSLAHQFRERFGISMIPVWGSTETMGIAFANPVDDTKKEGSIGRPCPYYQAKIVGENGEDLAENDIGEMAVKGPAVSAGYLENLEETRKCMKDGWFYTDDLARKDADGYFYFVARKSGMMKVAGMKVFPVEIEDVLSSHPKIAEAAVTRVYDRLHGEMPKAVIVLKAGEEMDKMEIRRYCEERMAKYKVPRVIEFRAELPKSPGGKVLYRLL